MGKCCQVSTMCVLCVVLAVVSVVTIVTLWTIALMAGETVTYQKMVPGVVHLCSSSRYRLPTSLVPESYSVTLWPRLSHDTNSGLYVFTGRSSVRFECATETDVILIHSNKLNYTRLNNTVPDILTSWLQEKTQYLVVHLTGPLTAGQKYELYAEFTGELADDLAGFYRSKYEEDGVRKIVATSQMHPTHARKTFPCFDEPAMKAVFNVTLIHPPGTVALSNDVANVTIDGESVTRTTFESSKKMSSYLLALVAEPCVFSLLCPQIRVWARRRFIERGQGDYALNVTGPILDFFQQYYNISYPLSKSDQIALPDFYFGAMENWGLVTYRETNLLYDPLTSSNRNQETTVTIIAHELAHMWFGNLVTLRWWNEVWLNEGFASYVAYLGADHAEPAWNVKDLIVLDDVHRVFAVDALASSHPLSSKEEDIVLPDQISEQFDVIAYSKGASVLRMLSDFLSEPVFVQGLNRYLNHFAESNTIGSDLWEHLQTAVEENRVSLPASVEDIMKPWVLQMGFPVVTIDTSSGEITQQHFLLDPDSNVTVQSPYKYEWLIPVRWMMNEEFQTKIFWLLEKQDMRSGASWLLANINVTGFYRVNYDLGNWERLLAQLSTDHQVIPVINRAQLVDDAFSLARRAGLLSSSVALRTSSFLSQETDFLPWQAAVNNLDYFYLMLDRTDVYQPLQDYVRKQVTPLFFHFKNTTGNWSRVPEGHTEQYSQVLSLRTACSCGLSECRTLSSSWFKRWMEEPHNNMIHPNLRSAVYCSGVAVGGEDEWEFAWSQFKMASVASEASELMSALACASDTRLLQRYLSYSLNSSLIRKQDATAVITSVAANRVGQSLAWDFVRENWNFIFTQYGVGSFSFASIITGVTARFSTPEDLRQVTQQGAAGFGPATLAVDQALEKTRANIKWLQKNKEEILDWLSGQTESENTGEGRKFSAVRDLLLLLLFFLLIQNTTGTETV
uniref:Aminopeptidase n=1 Tax=Salarias fasciatus TaxID=181472 RepID=A0A672HE55_SALFA